MHILLIEDDPAIADGIQRGLKAEQFKVDVAARGDLGWEKFRERAYDAVILDIMVPGLNGYLVCRNIRQSGSHVPILMLTAKVGEFDEAEGLDTGADDYLTKPFSWVVLLARLRALLRRSGVGQSVGRCGPDLVIGSLVVDPATREVSHDGRSIFLSPREFALLRYMMHKRGQVVSKEELLDHVWPDGGDANVVQVYIGYLRRKMDEQFSINVIETVRGVGYRMKEVQL